MRISEKIGFLILITFIAVSYMLVRNNDIKQDKYLRQEGLMTIATIIEQFSPMANGPSAPSPEIKFSFELDGNIYKDSYNASGVTVGNKYFLLVDKQNYKKTMILFDHPVKDSSDFKRYVKEFEQMRKQKAKK